MKDTIILFCGAAGSGKDTAFTILRDTLKKIDEDDVSPVYVSQFAFGRPLKEIVVDLCQLFLNEQYSLDEMNRFTYKEVERPEHTVYPDPDPAHSEPLIIRRLLQIVGTDFLRKRLGDDVFASAVLRDIDAFFDSSGNGQGVKVACVTDLRFPNEQKCIREYCDARGYNCVTVYIRRRVTSPTARTYVHVSESHYDQLEKNVVIENCGTLEDLEHEVRGLVSYLLAKLKPERG